MKFKCCKTFCWRFSLRSGVVILGTIFITICILTFTINTYVLILIDTVDSSRIPALTFIFGHIFFVLTAIGIGFFGAYKENITLMTIAAVLMLLALIIYLAASLLSYFPKTFHLSCIYNRCPDHVWMEDSYWRHVLFYRESRVELKGKEERGEEGKDSSCEETTASVIKSECTGQSANRNVLFRQLQGKGATTTRRYFLLPDHLYGPDENYYEFLEEGKPRVVEEEGAGWPDLQPGAIHAHEIEHPFVGLFISIVFNILYLLLLVLATGIYIAYAIEEFEEGKNWDEESGSR